MTAAAPAHARPSSGLLDRRVLAAWLWSRLALVVLSLGGAYTLSGFRSGQVEGFLPRWENWDVDLFRKVAQFGYQGNPRHYGDTGIEAFFPGFPLVLRVVHLVVPEWTAAGLVVSLVAGAVAVQGLGRLAALDGVAPDRAVLALLLSPYAVFLAAGYSESLWLAFALTGWVCARNGRWALASLLVAGACTVRISGLFLFAGLVVQYAVTVRRPRRDAAWLVLPPLALLGYAGYLHLITGDWLRWNHAQRDGWGRSLTAPWDAFSATLDLARGTQLPAEYAFAYTAEIVAVLVGVALTVVLLVQRRWGEATYVGLSVTALATSTTYLSVSRATLLWFPLWLLLARAGERRRWLTTAYLAVSAPLMVMLSLTWMRGAWIG